ncbi:geranylgeranyl transferase type-1 subunit beta isoform X1 [Selaginella moellendorffii]|uniref:geranylgeranyl transferase type-1 subunit beta isoform X1 n=1 Tax=Selaginella moellendorffii TaxID=88036 RepID=UPI000D1D02A9|nr:geranylgeranyl transferase type-1 subunit beta isoform X1 [Selaginella moellendorffii]|eukprot:XP_024542190.1 geranylgeranyl transferase type-1 subunit beta isoform X1 [Selaginella moellendorffii]
MAFFDRDAHVQFFAGFLVRGLSADYLGQECNTLSLAYFAISALDILNALNQIPTGEIVDWVYSLQVLPLKELDEYAEKDLRFGFLGSRSTYVSRDGVESSYDGGHLAMTYSALAILKILGDDYSRVSRNAIVRSMRSLQQPDGRFTPVHLGAERDSRFLFCAAAICTFLQDWSGMDVPLACDYIAKCQSYDGGFGLCPGLEAHGGATYCALAALKLIGQSAEKGITGIDFPLLTSWLLQRQAVTGGFQGRINKAPDTCYAFWVGASLVFLGAYELCDREALRLSLLSCQSEKGGFSKYPHDDADMLHSYYGVCGFSLLNEPGLESLCCELGISARAAGDFGMGSDTVKFSYLEEETPD